MCLKGIQPLLAALLKVIETLFLTAFISPLRQRLPVIPAFLPDYRYILAVPVAVQYAPLLMNELITTAYRNVLTGLLGTIIIRMRIESLLTVLELLLLSSSSILFNVRTLQTYNYFSFMKGTYFRLFIDFCIVKITIHI